MLLLKNQAINSNLCHLPLIILTTFTVHRDMMRNKHLLGVAPYPHRVLIAATLQKPSADFVKQWNPWIVLTNVAGPVYPPKNIQNIWAKQKVFFSWNSAYHQSCKNYELLVDSSDFGIYGCEKKMYYWWKSGHHSDFGHHSDSRNPCKILRKIFLYPRNTQTQHSQHFAEGWVQRERALLLNEHSQEISDLLHFFPARNLQGLWLW